MLSLTLLHLIYWLMNALSSLPAAFGLTLEDAASTMAVRMIAGSLTTYIVCSNTKSVPKALGLTGIALLMLLVTVNNESPASILDMLSRGYAAINGTLIPPAPPTRPLWVKNLTWFLHALHLSSIEPTLLYHLNNHGFKVLEHFPIEPVKPTAKDVIDTFSYWAIRWSCVFSAAAFLYLDPSVNRLKDKMHQQATTASGSAISRQLGPQEIRDIVNETLGAALADWTRATNASIRTAVDRKAQEV